MLIGSSPHDAFLTHAATVEAFATDAVALPGAEVLQALFEIRVHGREASLPPALHPTNPPTFVVQFWRCPDSRWGPFSLAQARVGSRSGLRPRGFVQGAFCDNPVAAAALGSGWGLPCRAAAVELVRRYDAVSAAVRISGGAAACELVGVAPEPLEPGDVSYSAGVALAHTPRGVRLVQIDAELAPTRAERLRPRLVRFDGAALGVHPSVEPYHPVSASISIGTLTIERVRYVCKPDELAFTGTETV